MAYNYAVIWFENAKSFTKGSPRPRLPEVRLFQTPLNVKRFRRGMFCGSGSHVYKLEDDPTIQVCDKCGGEFVEVGLVGNPSNNEKGRYYCRRCRKKKVN